MPNSTRVWINHETGEWDDSPFEGAVEFVNKDLVYESGFHQWANKQHLFRAYFEMRLLIRRAIADDRNWREDANKWMNNNQINL